MEGGLERTPARGVYLATSRTARRVAAYLEWKGVPPGGRLTTGVEAPGSAPGLRGPPRLRRHSPRPGPDGDRPD